MRLLHVLQVDCEVRSRELAFYFYRGFLVVSEVQLDIGGDDGKKGFIVTVVNIDAVCSRVRGLGGRESCRDGSSWGRSRSSSQDAPSV